ncbi:MAG TPA: DoxX family protein [Thermoanaerobaculia bacterium]|nr:DoxX family protein [Thermoanaerobaculia bacterium]
MNLRRVFAAPGYSTFPDLALLFTRLLAGVSFMFFGWSKIQDPFGWMGPDSPVPGIFQALAAVAEFGGGMAWIVGLLTPLASLGIAFTMAVAFAVVSLVYKMPFISKTGGAASVLPALLFAIAILLMAFGPGRFSLDRKIFGPR